MKQTKLLKWTACALAISVPLGVVAQETTVDDTGSGAIVTEQITEQEIGNVGAGESDNTDGGADSTTPATSDASSEESSANQAPDISSDSPSVEGGVTGSASDGANAGEEVVEVVLPSEFDGNIVRVIEGSATGKISVKVNRGVVLETAVPYSELVVASPEIADIATLSSETALVLGKSPGRTSMTLLGADGGLITSVDVQVEPDISELKERINAIMPGEQIQVRTANGGIVLSGRASSTTVASRAVDLAQLYAPVELVSNMMMVGGSNQVMLKVRFAEMQRTVAKQVGSSIGITGQNGIATTGTWVGQAGQLAPFPEGGNPTVDVGSALAGLFGFTTGGLAIDVLIEALEAKDLVRTLAEPNLTAVSGQEAYFLAGGEFPISTQDNVEYKPFGVGLRFRPHVLGNDTINLEIKTEVSDIDTNRAASITATDIPIILKINKASTVVELKDGQSIAIAGLLRDDFVDLSTQVPWLGDVPVLGALFRSAEFKKSQTELVVIVTAYLIAPVSGEVLSTSFDRIVPPSEADLFLFGNTDGHRSSGFASQEFSGSYGYVVE